MAGTLALTACIAHAPDKGGGGGGGGGKTTVSVSPATATLSATSTQRFKVSVTGPPNTAVVWNLNGSPGNDIMTAAGMLDQTGLYTAPATVPSPNSASITAVSVANGTSSNTATVTITSANVGIAVAPTSANIIGGSSQTFTATVTGTNDVVVGWYVDGILNGNEGVGTIAATSTSTGSSAIYTAPSNASSNTTVTITAASAAIPTITANATVTVAPIVVTISPSTPPNLKLPVGGTQQFAETVTGTSNTAVYWQVNGITGGNSTVGTIDAAGLYTAPSEIPASVTSGPFQATITALSQANSNYSASALVNVHVSVTITPSAGTMGQGANKLFTATVNGVANQSADKQGVYWSAPDANTGGFIPTLDTPWLPSTQGIYISPPLVTANTPIVVTIAAQAQFDADNAASASTTVTVLQNDPPGSVSEVKTLPANQCPAAPDGTLANGACFSMTVTCNPAADWTAYLKVNTPKTTPSGTVLFIGSQGGANLYDTEYTDGSLIVGKVLTSGYTTVQISFGAPFDHGANPNGWLTGPGGVRLLACRFATVASWIYNNPQTLNPSQRSSAPFCATGNGGGSSAIGYAVSEYGLNSIFKLIELTNGPTMTELDEGCTCNGTGPQSSPCNPTAGGLPLCYTSGMNSIDAAYSAPSVCTSGNTDNNLLLRSDSILNQRGKGAIFALPTTTLKQRFGKLDDADQAQGWAWNKSVSQNIPSAECEQSASQEMPDDSVSATDIANDITAECK
jgi:hypothetical protein